MSSAPAIVWFRQDLRLTDNAALRAAATTGPVLPCYIYDPAGGAKWPPGAASRWWLDRSLRSLAGEINTLGGRLILRRGPTVEVLLTLAQEIRARAIFCSRSYEPAAIALESKLKRHTDETGITLKRFGGNLLVEPDVISTASGTAYKVFTPYWRALRERIAGTRPAPRPRKPTWRSATSDDLNDWHLLPCQPDWSTGLQASWQPGETGAKASLAQFRRNALAGYAEQRDRPAAPGTSLLSPHLHFGELSPRQVWHAIQSHPDGSQQTAFLRQLGWREFSHYLLFHHPHLPDKPFRGAFTKFPWRQDAKALRAWQLGQTGYPLIDAGMRQLWHSGWMHNRVRMLCASFLTKHLLIPWAHGAAWFWDTLVDANLANNSAGWQWVAGCGADAAPYFRIFNPCLQGRKFDPDAHYVKHWVPELKRLEARFVHAPWEADATTLANAGLELGSDYPLPIVDHAFARERALAAYKSL